ncbi:extracellular solute-binding protein [Patescibacteria group bacterium]|nr:extracellular solute-binding protein [Patescibacteria group bacterium]MBU1931263.1 extracellular solute-binding protein [Patescibacteria group bacterium]
MIDDNQSLPQPPWMQVPPKPADSSGQAAPKAPQLGGQAAPPEPITPEEPSSVVPQATPDVSPATPQVSQAGGQADGQATPKATHLGGQAEPALSTSESPVAETASNDSALPETPKPPLAESPEPISPQNPESVPAKTMPSSGEEIPDSTGVPSWMAGSQTEGLEPTSTMPQAPAGGDGQTPPPGSEPPESDDLEQPVDAVSPKSSPFKKIIPLVIGLVLISTIVFGAFKIISQFRAKDESDKVQKQESITLTWWGLWEPKNLVSQVVLDYQRSHENVSIDYIQQSHKDYREKLQSALARDEGPDIFRFHNTWVPMLKKELAIMPTSVYSSSSFASTFYPVNQQDLGSGGSYIGVPLMYDGLALFYNKAMLAAKGIAAPTTWEQFRKAASELTEWDADDKIIVAGAALGTTNNISNFSDILALMFLQNGADLANPTGQLAEDALSFYTIFVSDDRVWDESLPASHLAFANGQVAMILAPSWWAIDIKAIAPALDFGVAPVPQLPSTNINWASYWVEGISAKSKYKTEAWEFLKYLSEKETLQKFYSSAASTRGFGEIYSRRDLADLLKTDPLVGAFVTQAPEAQSWYMCSQTHDNGINDRIINYYKDAVNSVVSGHGPRQALEPVAQGVQQVLSQYKVN